jgi:16S rRNA (guanine527-N7)-methyltransferase
MFSRAQAEKFLAQGLKNFGLALEDQPEALARLSLYFEELNKWNQKVNLVARSLDERQILENHFLDSLTLLILLNPKMHQETVLDIGSGAGFPGLVLKAACPNLSITLVEPLKKRYYFLKHIIRTLNLSGVEVFNIYLDEKKATIELPARHFTMVTSRAFTEVSRFLRLGSAYLREEGRIVMMKGPGLDEELANLAQDDMSKQFQLTEKRKLLLPYAKKERWLVSFSRIG